MSSNSISGMAPINNTMPADGGGDNSSKISALEQKLQMLNGELQKAAKENNTEKQNKIKEQIQQIQKQIQNLKQQSQKTQPDKNEPNSQQEENLLKDPNLGNQVDEYR